MAAEAKRGCGYRKVGGLYLVGGGIGVPCDRLPYEIHECPTCHHAIAKQGRGWQWLDVNTFVEGPHMVHNGKQHARRCTEALEQSCTFCAAPELMGEAGLIWIGEQFYKTPAEFVAEGMALGFSRRIAAIPNDFKLGETYVLLAHPKAIRKLEPVPPVGEELFETHKEVFAPGIFYIWKPQRIEKILVESQRGTEEVEKLEKRGITPVFVPDNDPDHQPPQKKDGPANGLLIEEE